MAVPFQVFLADDPSTYRTAGLRWDRNLNFYERRDNLLIFPDLRTGSQ